MSLDGETSSLVNAIDVTHDIYDSAHMIIETAKARSAVKSMHSRPLLTIYLTDIGVQSFEYHVQNRNHI